jgi:type IV pilus assembly protein PilV
MMHSTSSHSQTGFLLIEALIALLLFSIGMLGLIGMQASAAKVAADSQYRAEASMHVDHLLSEMRSSGNPLTLAVDYAAGSPRLQAWVDTIQDTATGLPGAAAVPPEVTIVGTPATVTVTVSWQVPGETVPHRYVAVATMN